VSKANEPLSERELWPVQIVVNGSSVAGDVEPRTLLIDFLRNNAQLSGPRIGCEEGACGACTVELDGQTIKSCLTLAVQADGGSITTIEGVAENDNLAKVQQAFIDCHAVQCGYCTSGMIMSARAFLDSVGSADFSDEDVRHALSGNYCRCTGYNNIIQAVKVAAGKEASPVHCDTDASPDGNWIGQPVVRREDNRLVRGAGRYTDNYGSAADLHLFIVRSGRAHANIKSIDTKAAKNAPGVTLVLTGQEALKHWQPISPTMDLLDLNLPRRYAIAVDKVIYYGEPIAIVVATNPYLAEDAARLVEVEYEDLPTNTDLVRAADVGAGDSALLYPDWGSNIQVEFAFELGKVDAAFANADLIVDEEIVLPRIGAMPMETRMVHADFNRAEQRLVIRASTQVPHQMRMYMSQVFSVPESHVQVVVGDVGGGFGSKLGVDTELVPTLATIVLGRPVKWFESRSEWMFAGPAARDYKVRSRAAFDSNGKLLAHETDVLADMGCDGAERAAGLGMPLNGANYSPGPYVVDTYRTRVRCVVTNKPPYSAYRGYGKDLANIMMERVLDQAADKLEIDPVEIRHKNILTNYPHQICTGPVIENGSLREALDKVVELMDLDELRREQAIALQDGRHIGICVVPYIEPAGAAFPGSAFQNYESATVRVAADGSVLVMTGIQNIGQGIETAYAQVTADLLGCRLGDVSVSWGDTTAIPFGSGTFASRGAMYAVGAIVKAAEKIKPRLLVGAAVLLECSVHELEIKNAIIKSTKRDVSCTLAELAYACYIQPGAEIILTDADAPLLEATGTYRHPQVSWKFDELGRAQFYPSHAGGAAAAMVEVDPETGKIEVLKIWMVADHGVILNPLILSGQIKGGIVQQLGGTLYESFEYDADGIPYAKTMKDYGMPTVWAAPPLHIEHLVTKSPATSIGAKGGGEDGCIATTTVLMGAVEDALRPFGVKVMHGQLSPARVRSLIATALEK
jgi:carbon-monoxide dehydrogenase large subunit